MIYELTNETLADLDPGFLSDEDIAEEYEEEEEEQEESGEEEEEEPQPTETPEQPEQTEAPEKGAEVPQRSPEPKGKPKEDTASRKAADVSDVRAELKALKDEIETSKREGLIKEAKVPQELVPTIPKGYQAAKDYLNSEAYKKVMKAVTAYSTLEAQEKQDPKADEGEKKPKDSGKPSRSETFTKLGKMLMK